MRRIALAGIVAVVGLTAGFTAGPAVADEPTPGATVYEDGSWRNGDTTGCIDGALCDNPLTHEDATEEEVTPPADSADQQQATPAPTDEPELSEAPAPTPVVGTPTFTG